MNRGGCLPAFCSILLFCFGLWSCASQDPTDLTFVSVKGMDFHDLPTHPSLHEFMRAEAALRRWEVWKSKVGAVGGDGPEKSDNLFKKLRAVRVDFTSRADLLRHQRAEDLPLHLRSYFCDRRIQGGTLSPDVVFWRDLQVNNHDDHLLLKRRIEPVDGLYHYAIHIYVQGDEVGYAPHPSGSYNLQDEQPDDICFHLAGGGQIGGYKSNTVTVPKSAIEAALRNEPPGLAR